MYSKIDTLGMVNDFLMNIETSVADAVLTSTLNSTEYIRLQVVTTSTLDSFGPKNENQMKIEGKKMFDDPLEPATKS